MLVYRHRERETQEGTEMTTLREMTVEHLGNEATESDLTEFVEAVDRVRDGFATEAEAIDYVWNDGEWTTRLMAGFCAYCGKLVEHGVEVPSANDDEAWELITAEHAADCEWVTTRAHRLEAAND
jgi:hypothetical protein